MPFKFNCVWLKDPTFNKLVTDFWRRDGVDEGLRGWEKLTDKLRRLKVMVKQWEYRKKLALKKEYRVIEDNISKIYKEMLQVPPNSEVYSILEKLEARNFEILKIQETSWKLKSIIKWLKEGYLNTSFFHKCTDSCRNKNAIWGIQVADGTIKHTK